MPPSGTSDILATRLTIEDTTLAAHAEMLDFLRSCNAADGFVYILINESLQGLIKIGFTDRRPDDRALELHTTGVPTPFKIAFCFQHRNARSAEQTIHKELASHRVSSDREFFRCEVTNAVTHIFDRFSPEDFFDSANYAGQYEVFDEAVYTIKCTACDGVGQVLKQQGFFQVQQTCPTCLGRGKVKE